MMHNINIKYEEAIDISEVVIESLFDAWRPSSDILFTCEVALSIIGKLVRIERSEFAMQNIRVLASDGDVMGVTLAMDLSYIQKARQANIFGILSSVDNKKRFMERLSRYNKCFQPLPEEDGIYLSKFAVTRQFRGQGKGVVLMDHFLNYYGYRPIFLEVHKSNDKAIKLYERYHFMKVANIVETEYIFMKRMPQVH